MILKKTVINRSGNMDRLISKFNSIQLNSLPLNTTDISLISHTHGRDRRNERNISKNDLKAAIKYGRKERAAPGRNGEARWKYTYAGVVYITDATSRHEVTSWRIDDAIENNNIPIMGSQDSFTSHTIIVVDCSGSMRQSDCLGYSTRTKCTYECLVNQFVKPQLDRDERESVKRLGNAVVSLIEMRDEAEILLNKVSFDKDLMDMLSDRGDVYARSHGNYIPALDAVTNLIKSDVCEPVQFFIVFLSDGAPSDHIDLACEHGVQVWKDDGTGRKKFIKGKSKLLLQDCTNGSRCRNQLKQLVVNKILKRVSRLGDLCGRDRVRLHTVAFGNPREDFAVLQQMASKLPLGSFQKLSLSAVSLSSAFTTLTSSLTTLRTESNDISGKPKTLRQMEKDTETPSASAHEAGLGHDVLHAADGWHIYRSRRVISPEHQSCGFHGCKIKVISCCSVCKTQHYCSTEHQKADWSRHKTVCPFLDLDGQGYSPYKDPYILINKKKYDISSNQFVDVPLSPGATGIAMKNKYFAKGVERAAFYCTECSWSTEPPLVGEAVAEGPRLIAKESLHEEPLLNAEFHRGMCKLQAYATEMAKNFNEELKTFSSLNMNPWNISFVECFLYEVQDHRYASGKAWILGEMELDGKFTKWNNNNGKVLESLSRGKGSSASSNRFLGVIAEEEEEEEGEEEDDDADSGANLCLDIPQCFSHFSYVKSGGKQLICDLQGVWNQFDGFMFTDPVIHSQKSHTNGPTDKGLKGISNFFETHKCSFLCELLSLTHMKYKTTTTLSELLGTVNTTRTTHRRSSSYYVDRYDDDEDYEDRGISYYDRMYNPYFRDKEHLFDEFDDDEYY